LPPLIRAFARERPDISVDLVSLRTEEIASAVAGATADIGVSEEIDSLAVPEHLRIVHWVDAPASLFVAGEVAHPARPRPIVYTVLHDSDLLAGRARELAAIGLGVPEFRSLPSVEAVKGACAAGLGYALLPRCSALLELQAGLITEVEGFAGTLRGAVAICSPTDDLLTSTARALLRFMQANNTVVRLFLTLS
jgi:DNA-binding transcriptional LysR family regulator